MTQTSTGLYPPIEPFNHGRVPVSARHSLYYEQVGNPEGKPVVFLHGGPGGGVMPDYRRYFNPQKWHVMTLCVGDWLQIGLPKILSLIHI